MEKFEPQGTDNQVGLALLCRFGIHVRNQISYTLIRCTVRID